MTDLTDKLAAERAKEQAATPGPWDNDSGTGRLRRPQGLIAGASWDTEQAAADARLIVSARNAYVALLDVAEAALKYECHGSIDEADCPDAQLNAALARLDEVLGE
jgi:hypothetical protein